MKYYIRQIKPYLQLPKTPGTLNISRAVDGYGWAPEDMEEELRKKIVVEEPWGALIFEERFVEVEL
jgi:hypothetical protein